MTSPVAQPSIAWEDVEQALVDWATSVTGCETIWQEEDGPQPTRPYVSLDWLVPPSGVGDDYFKDTAVTATQELERELQGVRRGVLTVNVHSDSTLAGRNAMAIADLLTSSLASESTLLAYFSPNRMACWGTEPMRKGSWNEDGKSLSRAAFDMTLGFSAGVGLPSERVPYIASVAITATINTATTAFNDSASATS